MLQRADTSAARVFRADLREMPFAGGTIDVVVSALVFMDVPELTPALREIARVLRVGGVLVYSVLHPDGAARGWTRTFDSPGGRHVVRAWWHSIDDQQRACLDAGLLIEATREPCLDQGSGGPRVPVARVVRARRVA
jgi:SAM-dependent methyltransferase